jgi:hypothetical protein
MVRYTFTLVRDQVLIVDQETLSERGGSVQMTAYILTRVAKTLAHYDTATTTAVKRFIIQNCGLNVKKLFTSVIYECLIISCSVCHWQASLA